MPAPSPVSFSVWPRLSPLPPAEQWQARANSCANVVPPVPWGFFVEWLATPVDSIDKHEQAYSPLVSIQPGKGGRVDGGLAQFLALEYDDTATPVVLAAAQALLRSRGIAAVVYTTASATPDVPRFRVVMPVSRPLDDAAYASCVDHFGRLVGVRPAPESRQRTRLWYRPIKGAMVTVIDGGPWDVEASLKACPPPPPRVIPPAPSADALASWPLEERVRQAWARLVARAPAGAFACGCVCHDHGLPEDVARAVVVLWAQQAGWSFEPGDIADRVEHAYEYARDPFGCRLMPSILTHPDLRERIAAAVAGGAR